MKTCTYSTCSRKHRGNGLCGMHLHRQQRGQPLGPVESVRITPGQLRIDFENMVRLETDDCILWPITAGDVYGYGRMSINGKRAIVHRMALERHVGAAPEDKPYALHSCRNRNCLNYRHLRWGTPQENQDDMIKDGTSLRGKLNPNNKLTPEQALAIRQDVRSTRAIAKSYSIAQATVCDIKSKRSWAWL